MDPQWLGDPASSSELGYTPPQAEPISPPPRNLPDYLSYLHDGNERLPEQLYVTSQMLTEFRELYQLTEKTAAEHGYALLYDPKTGAFSRGATVKGNAYSVDPLNMPGINDPKCFGYVHAHPSASIGHAGGYSAHSIQDLLMFEYYWKISRFFLFVASGPKLYAMVYVQGVSKWSDDVKRFLEKRLRERQNKEGELLYEAAGGRAKWESDALELSDEEALAELRERTLAKFSDLGRRLEEISISECTLFAKTFNYAFIVS